jgi:hypothetical protein
MVILPFSNSFMLVFCKKKVLIIQKLQIYTNTPFETSIQNLHCINVTADGIYRLRRIISEKTELITTILDVCVLFEDCSSRQDLQLCSSNFFHLEPS